MINTLKRFLAVRIERLIAQQISLSQAKEEARFQSYLKSPNAVKALTEALATSITIWGNPNRITLGDNVLLVNALLNVNSGLIDIGSDTFFGHNVSIITGAHPIKSIGKERHTFPTEGRDITIGKGVWIATNAVVLGPCLIGDNAVVAAGSVVVAGTNIPANTVYAGVPAKFLKSLP